MRPRRVGVNEMVVCRDCGTGAVLGEPMMDAYWADEQADPLADVYWEARRTMFANALEHLARTGRGRRILDLGGGVGHFAEIALQRGWDAYSTDHSAAAAAAAAERLGQDRSIRGTTVGDYAHAFDVVTLWCVLAHVADPAALLHEAASMLAPGGRVLITTPNFLFQRPYARVLNMAGRPLDFRREDHLLSFTPEALRRLAGAAGFIDPKFHYFGVTEACVFQRRLGGVALRLKRVWNAVGSRASIVGLPPLGGDLQFTAVMPPETG